MGLRKNIGAVIKRLRRQAGLSQDAVARKAGISQRYLLDIEAGRRAVSLNVLANLAAVFSLPLSGLVAEAEKEDAVNHV